MRLLLDTHVVLWWLTDDPVLADDLKERLDHEPDAYVSAATIWEVAIKQAMGKLLEPADLPEQISSAGFTPLPISFKHAAVAGRLPMIHRDPFDRMLVAQAQCEGLTLVTHDENCQKYDVEVLAVLRLFRKDGLTLAFIDEGLAVTAAARASGTGAADTGRRAGRGRGGTGQSAGQGRLTHARVPGQAVSDPAGITAMADGRTAVQLTVMYQRLDVSVRFRTVM